MRLKLLNKKRKFVKMKNTEKLKIVFDFISDYLTEEDEVIELEGGKVIEDEVEEPKEDEVTMTDDDAKFKRAYTIMKKIDEIDKQNAFSNQAVKEATKPLKEIINQSKKEFDETLRKDDLVDSFDERTSTTVDSSDKIADVTVGPLKEYVKIKDMLGTPNVLTDNPNIKMTNNN